MRDIVLLNDLKYEGVINIPVFDIEYLPSKIDLLSFDGLIFTSKNAVKAVDSFNKHWKEIPTYCIAPKTSNVVIKQGGTVAFTGKSSHGDSFANELLSLVQGKKLLYIKAEKTVSSLSQILKNNAIDIHDLVAYKTACNEMYFDAPLENSIIIFSAPSTVKCFFDKYEWLDSYKAIAIGKTTAKYIPKEVDFVISEVQSVDSCVKLAQTLQKINL